MFHCLLVCHFSFLLRVVHGVGKYWPLLRLEPEISLAFRSSFHSKLGGVYSPTSRVLEMAVKMCLDEWKGMAWKAWFPGPRSVSITTCLSKTVQRDPQREPMFAIRVFLHECEQHSGTTSAIFCRCAHNTTRPCSSHQHCAKLSAPNPRQQRFRTFVKRRPGSRVGEMGIGPSIAC